LPLCKQNRDACRAWRLFNLGVVELRADGKKKVGSGREVLATGLTGHMI
jgi:hypothetical protein